MNEVNKYEELPAKTMCRHGALRVLNIKKIITIQMSTFDVFLVPSETQYTKYEKVINSFATKKYKTPSFPHITLLNLVEAEEKEIVTTVQRIVRNLKQIDVEVFGINFTNTVSQCVFAQIKMTTQLLNLFQELETGLKHSEKSPFFPHLSLVYGNLSSEEKANIANQVEVDKRLLLDKVMIYSDGPLASDWRKVDEFELG
jgi:2'-5' RNA ligase